MITQSLPYAMCQFVDGEQTLLWYGFEPVRDSALAKHYDKDKRAIRIPLDRKDRFPHAVADMMGMRRSKLIGELGGTFGPVMARIEVSEDGAAIRLIEIVMPT